MPTSSKILQQNVQGQAYTLVLFQLIGVGILTCAAFVGVSPNSALGVLLGGLAYCLPNFLLVALAFRFVGARAATQFMVTFFFGEFLKLILSAFLVLVIVKYLPDSLLSVLVGFIGAIVSFWVACMWFFGRKKS